MARKGGGGDRFQQMAEKRDAMMQKLIDALDNNAKAAGGGAGGGSGTGGGGGGVSPSRASKSGGLFGPDAGEFREREDRLTKLADDAHSATLRGLEQEGALAPALMTNLGKGLAGAAPGFFAKTLTAAVQPGFSGMDVIGNAPTSDSAQQAAARGRFEMREAAIRQEIEADKNLLLANAAGDKKDSEVLARTLRQDEDRLRTVRQQEQDALVPEEQAKAVVRRQFARAGEVGAFEGPDAEKITQLMQKQLNFQGRLARGRAAMEQKLRGMTINLNQGELGNQ